MCQASLHSVYVVCIYGLHSYGLNSCGSMYRGSCHSVCIFMACVVMAYMIMAQTAMAYITMVDIGLYRCVEDPAARPNTVSSYLVVACIVMNYMITAYIVIAYIVIASIVIAYIVMACRGGCRCVEDPAARHFHSRTLSIVPDDRYPASPRGRSRAGRPVDDSGQLCPM